MIRRPAPPAPACTSAVWPARSGNVELVRYVRGGALEHHRGGRAGVQRFRNAHQPVGGHGLQLGIGAELGAMRDAIAALKRGHLGPNVLDDAGAFHAQRERQVERVAARALIGVDEVHPRGFHSAR